MERVILEKMIMLGMTIIECCWVLSTALARSYGHGHIIEGVQRYQAIRFGKLLGLSWNNEGYTTLVFTLGIRKVLKENANR